jgi:hypothetical protein
MKQNLSMTIVAMCVAICGGSACAAAAPAFECPQPIHTPKVSASELRSLLPVGDPLADPAKLNTAVEALRGQGLSKGLIIDSLIGAYCPTVAADRQLTPPQKASRLQRFAMRIAQNVYAMKAADEIIFDVPFGTVAANAIEMRAKAAGVTPEQWIAQTAGQALTVRP